MKIVSMLFWMGVSVGVGLIVFVFLIKIARKVPLIGNVANIAASASGVSA